MKTIVGRFELNNLNANRVGFTFKDSRNRVMMRCDVSRSDFADALFGRTIEGLNILYNDNLSRWIAQPPVWQPIESAPLGKRLLGLVVGRKRNFVTQVAYCPNAKRWYGELGLEEIEVTHWLPLPDVQVIQK